MENGENGNGLIAPMLTTDATGFTVQLPGGIVLGADEPSGVGWVLDDLEGWDTTDSTGEVHQRSDQHGGWTTPAFYRPRHLVARGVIFGTSRAQVRDAMDRLLASIPLEVPGPVVVTQDGLTRQAHARQHGPQVVRWAGPYEADYDLQLVCPDSRKLSAGSARTLSTGLPAVVGGLTVPFDVPFTIDASGSAGVLRVTNTGSVEAPATLRIDGPVQYPQITHAQSGRTIALDLLIDAGQHVDLDLDHRTVMLNGTTSRRGRMRGDWFTLRPGLNTISWGAVAGTEDSTLTATWRDAWR